MLNGLLTLETLAKVVETLCGKCSGYSTTPRGSGCRAWKESGNPCLGRSRNELRSLNGERSLLDFRLAILASGPKKRERPERSDLSEHLRTAEATPPQVRYRSYFFPVKC